MGYSSRVAEGPTENTGVGGHCPLDPMGFFLPDLLPRALAAGCVEAPRPGVRPWAVVLQRPPGKSCLAGPVCSAWSPEEGGRREGEFLSAWLVWGHPSAPESGEGPGALLGTWL